MSYHRPGGTCRCPMCGTKDSKAPARNSYIRAGVTTDEHGLIDARHKVTGRRLRRRREKRSWMADACY